MATAVYAPFAFFNLINPLISAIYGFTGFTIDRDAPSDDAAVLAEGAALDPIP